MKTIAIVDDDAIQQLMIKKLIDVAQIANKIFTFSNGKEILDYIIENSVDVNLLPNVILLDINMPVMSGFEFLRHFGELELVPAKKIHMYVLSSSIDTRDIALAKNDANVSDFIKKPITIEKLREIANEVFNNERV